MHWQSQVSAQDCPCWPQCRLLQELADLKAQIDGVNRERKLQQTAAGQELGALEAEWQVRDKSVAVTGTLASRIVAPSMLDFQREHARGLQPVKCAQPPSHLALECLQELIAKNGEIERACRMVEDELALMQAASQLPQQ